MDVKSRYSGLKRALNREFFIMSFKSLGVVYGDIGTSPLYTLPTAFAQLTTISNEDVYGSISLILWTLILLCCVKYVFIILSADSEGQGGTFALLAILLGKKKENKKKLWAFLATIVSIIAGSMVMADGVLTPAISILSAMEGLEIYSPSLESAVVPISVVILIILFFCQRFGSNKIGTVFAPVMTIWFFAIGIIGIYNLSTEPKILRAFNPWEAVMYLVRRNTSDAFYMMGGIFLTVTGGEALYADIGHFGANPIRFGWTLFVMPALIFNYLGQGAVLLQYPNKASSPFYNAVPEAVFWPMLILATMATTIASQSMITGCFSLIHQAVSLGYCPPVVIRHTSKRVYGQIYIPLINWILLILTVIITVTFRKSAIIGDAFGVTVSTVMMLTSVIYAAVMIIRYKTWWPKVVLFIIVFLPLDVTYWIANLTKIPHAGWVSLIFAAIFGIPMVCWYYGETKLKAAIRNSNVLSMAELTEGYSQNSLHEDSIYSSAYKSISTINSIYPGVSIFYTNTKHKVPESFIKLTNRLQSVAKTIVFCHISVENVPFVEENERLEVLEHGSIFVATIKYGYADVQEDVITTLAKHQFFPTLKEDNIAIFLDFYIIKILPTKNFVKRGMLGIYSLEKLLFREKVDVFQDNLLVETGINMNI